MGTIYLQPFGDINYSALLYIKENLGDKFSLGCRIGVKNKLPEEKYDSSRRQYVAGTFLSELGKLVPRDALKALAIVNEDLYASNLNFVFGEAEVGGKCAVISLFRLYPEFYGFPPDSAVFYKRVLKEAIHELGHTFGLGHCRRPDCIMFFSNSITDTDNKSEDFCSACLTQLQKAVKDMGN